MAETVSISVVGAGLIGRRHVEAVAANADGQVAFHCRSERGGAGLCRRTRRAVVCQPAGDDRRRGAGRSGARDAQPDARRQRPRMRRGRHSRACREADRGGCRGRPPARRTGPGARRAAARRPPPPAQSADRGGEAQAARRCSRPDRLGPRHVLGLQAGRLFRRRLAAAGGGGAGVPEPDPRHRPAQASRRGGRDRSRARSHGRSAATRSRKRRSSCFASPTVRSGPSTSRIRSLPPGAGN